MIVSEYVEVIINRGNISFYRKNGFGDISISDIIRIPIDNLPFGSNLIISVKCDYCVEIIKISYKLYNKRIKINGKFACCKKCAAIRTKEIIKDTYGVLNISQVPYIKDKIKKTNMERYGSETYISSDDAKIKIINTLIDRYGVDNPQKSKEVREKTENTNMERYGYSSMLGSPEMRERLKIENLKKFGFKFLSQTGISKEKAKNTNLCRYGFVSPMQNIDIKNKSKNTLIKNYGVDNPLKSELIRERVKNTNLERRGVEYPTQSKDVINKSILNTNDKYGVDFYFLNEDYRFNNFKISKDINYIKYISSGISLFKCDNNKNHNFEIHCDNYFSRVKNNISLCNICYPIGDQKSIKEKELFYFINNFYKGEIISGHRDGLEIDIYLPELKIGFEFNGLYFHSNKFKHKNYHLNKTDYFKERGIRIIHIWEDDWDFKRDIVESQIKNWLFKTNNRIYARKCDIKIISDVKIVREFLNDNHIQGYVNSVIKIGLYYNEELVSLMTFDNFEGRKRMEEGGWNLSRFCNKLNTNVIGGSSKLFNFFKRLNKISRVVSYADSDWSVGDLYYKLGFEKVNYLKPDYKYILNGKRAHKSKYRKSNLNTKLTENEKMKKLNINKIYDCGKIKFELFLDFSL